MDDIPDDYKHKKTRNTKAIVLFAILIAVISFAAYNSYQTKYVDDQSGSIHATLVEDITLNGGRVRAKLINDGVLAWDIDSVEIIGAKTNCWRLKKGVEHNETATVSCTGSGIDEGASYSVVIWLTNSSSFQGNTEQRYMISGMAEFRPN